MGVEAGKQISIEYTLSIEPEGVVDSNVDSDPLTYIQGQQQIVPAPKVVEVAGGEEDTGVRAGTEAAGASRRKCPKAVEVSAPPDGRSADAQTNER